MSLILLTWFAIVLFVVILVLLDRCECPRCGPRG